MMLAKVVLAEDHDRSGEHAQAILNFADWCY